MIMNSDEFGYTGLMHKLIRKKVITLGRVEELGKVMQSERMCRIAKNAVPPNYDMIKRKCLYYIGLATGMNILTQEPIAVSPVTEDEVAWVYDIFRQSMSAKAADEADLKTRLWRLEAMWSVMQRDMLANRGFYEFVKENGLDSDFMLQFYFDIPNRVRPGDQLPEGLVSDSSHLMDTAYGWYICGNGTYREIPVSDQAARQVVYEATWGGIRFRGANTCYERLQLGDGALIASLCAGTSPESRFFDWQNRGVKQRLVAYDENLQLQKALPVVFPKPLSEYGIERFYFDEMKQGFKNPDLYRACDMTLIQGGLSYNFDHTQEVFEGMKNITRPGGCICGEVQVGEIGLLNCSKTLGWEETRRKMQPDQDVPSAQKRIEECAHAAGLKVDIMMDDYSSGFNYVPTTVWFKLIV